MAGEINKGENVGNLPSAKADIQFMSEGMFMAQQDPKISKSDSRFWASNPDAPQNYIDLAKGTLKISDENKQDLKTLPDLEFDVEDAPEGVTTSDVFTTKEAFDKRLATERETIEERIKRQGDEKRSIIASQFDPLIEERKEFREDITESVEGQFATKRRLSTASLSFVQHNRDEAQKKVDEMVAKKNVALAQLDVQSEAEIDKEIAAWKNEEKYWMNLEQDVKKNQFSEFLSLANLELSQESAGRAAASEVRAEESHVFDTIIQEYNIIKDIPLGEEVTIGDFTFKGIEQKDVEPFYSSSDLTARMKAMPVGTSETITDPATGQEYLLTGLKEDIYTVTDDRGNVTAMNKNTGEVKWQVAGVGKTKTRAASTTIVMNQQQQDAFQEARKLLENSVNEAGVYDSEVYRTERLRFGEITGKPELFDDQFKTGLDKTDPANALYFDQSELDTVEGEVSYSPEQRETLLGLGLDEEDINAYEVLGLEIKDLIN